MAVMTHKFPSSGEAETGGFLSLRLAWANGPDSGSKQTRAGETAQPLMCSVHKLEALSSALGTHFTKPGMTALTYNPSTG